MTYKSLFLLFLSIIIFSLNFVVASENNSVSLEDTSEGISLEINDLSSEIENDNSLINSLSEENSLCDANTEQSIKSDKVIYVGHNNVTEGGNGSYDNPYSTFKAACDNVSGEYNVTIYVFEGTYKMGEGMTSGIASPLKFNTSNLNIIGNGSVIIKNYFNKKGGKNSEAFSLVSNSANFTFSNIVFDVTGFTQRYTSTTYFAPFYGRANLGIYNNCSFIMGGGYLFDYMFDTRYVGCKFVTKDNEFLFYRDINSTKIFKNCIFGYQTDALATYKLPFYVLMDDV